jgi:non-heme chloroperoxidase
VLKPQQWIAAANALDLLPTRSATRVRALRAGIGLATFEIMHWMFDLKRATQVDPRAVTCPILCFAGARPRQSAGDGAPARAPLWRTRAIYEELRGHSHWLIGEPGWEKIAARTLEWLDEVLAESEQARKPSPLNV